MVTPRKSQTAEEIVQHIATRAGCSEEVRLVLAEFNQTQSAVLMKGLLMCVDNESTDSYQHVRKIIDTLADASEDMGLNALPSLLSEIVDYMDDNKNRRRAVRSCVLLDLRHQNVHDGEILAAWLEKYANSPWMPGHA